MEVFMAKKKAIIEQKKELIEFFDPEQVNEWKILLAKMHAEQKKTGILYSPNIDEALVMRSLMYYIEDDRKAAKLLEVPIQLIQRLKNIDTDHFFANLLRHQKAKMLEVADEIIEGADKEVKNKLKLSDAKDAAGISEKYFNRKRLLEGNSTGNLNVIVKKFDI